VVNEAPSCSVRHLNIIGPLLRRAVASATRQSKSSQSARRVESPSGGVRLSALVASASALSGLAAIIAAAHGISCIANELKAER
jgi:hypothetical protein